MFFVNLEKPIYQAQSLRSFPNIASETVAIFLIKADEVV